LQAEIENPLSGKKVLMKEFLAWTLNELQPLADALGMSATLEPLREMASDGQNASLRLRHWLRGQGIEVGQEVPLEPLIAIAETRRKITQRRRNDSGCSSN
jgi:gamma-glutamyl:cysteine ligase YbdK (ATP-grasp superfamily)